MNIKSTTTNKLPGAFLLLVSFIAFLTPASGQQILNNSKLRFGTGVEQSINTTGNLQQPFYYNSIYSAWRKLTYSNYSLDNAFALNGIKTNDWNTNGTIVQNPPLSNQVINATGFTYTSGNSGYGTITSTGNITVAGQMMTVQTTYVLPQNNAYIKVTTRVTNSSAALMENLRIWIGTRDDWVGQTDQPTKQRGNLVNGAFAQVASATVRAAAVQIKSGDEGVLFYTNSNRGNTVVNSCCSFINVINQNPATSTNNITNDGSYAFYVRMNDLAVGESDEFTWYYAAGELAQLDQIVADVATVSGAVQNIAYTTAQLNATSSVSATGYFLVVPQGATAPTAAQIQAGVNYGTVTVADAGSGAMTANVQQAFNMTGLAAGTNYNVYFVSQDAANAYSTVTSVPFTTQAYTAPTVATAATSGVTQTTAASGGNVTADGGQSVTARGICWNTTGAPTTANSHTTDGSGSGSFSSSLSGLSAGTTYYVRAYATNSVGTSYGSQVSFATCAANPTIAASGATTFCQGSNVTLTASVGTSYLWSNNAITRSITVNQAGSYSVAVTTAAGCTAQSAPTVVAVNPLPTSSVTTVPPLCFGGNNGSITFSAVAGTSPFTYSINGGAAYQGSNVFSTVSAGTYSVIVKDGNSCVSTPQSVAVAQPAQLTFTTTKTDVACNGGNNGSITVNATGGSGSTQYSINGGTYQSANVFSNLTAGTYDVLVKDMNNCTAPS